MYLKIAEMQVFGNNLLQKKNGIGASLIIKEQSTRNQPAVVSQMAHAKQTL